MGMKIITQKLYVPMTVVPGVKTYKIYPLQFAEVYVDNVLSFTGMAPAGAMELLPDINKDTNYYEADGHADGFAPEMAPSFDPEFVQKYDNIATRVEM